MTKEQWGNIELPGVSDQDLLNKNWNKVAAAKNATEARLKLKEQDPNAYFAKNSAKTHKFLNDESYLKNQKAGVENRSKNLEWHAKVAEARRAEAQRPGEFERRSAMKQKLYNSPEGNVTKEKQRQQAFKRAKPVVTPHGIFKSVGIAVEYFMQHNIITNKNLVAGGHKLRKWLIDDPKNYYYITNEEYIMLTGKDIV